MSNVQIPKSIKKIAKEVKAYAETHDIICIEDVPVLIQADWEQRCNHELFYQDINRYIWDIHSEISRTRPTFW